MKSITAVTAFQLRILAKLACEADPYAYLRGTVAVKEKKIAEIDDAISDMMDNDLLRESTNKLGTAPTAQGWQILLSRNLP